MLTAGQLRALRRLPRSGHSWEGQVLVSEGGSAPFTFAAWVDTNASAIRTVQIDRARRDPAAFALKSFARAATEPAGAVRAELPSRIHVRERQLAIGLRALEHLGVVVEQTDELPGIWQLHVLLLDYLAEHGDADSARVAREFRDTIAHALDHQDRGASRPPATAAPGEELESVTVARLDVERGFLPEGVRVGIGGVPWAELDAVRRRAQVHQPAPIEPIVSGPGLPAVTIFADAANGRRIARELREAELQGIVVVRYAGRGTLVLALTASRRALELVRVRDGAGDEQLANAIVLFERRTRDLGGAHALLVVDASDPRDRSPAVLGLFETVLVRRD